MVYTFLLFLLYFQNNEVAGSGKPGISSHFIETDTFIIRDKIYSPENGINRYLGPGLITGVFQERDTALAEKKRLELVFFTGSGLTSFTRELLEYEKTELMEKTLAFCQQFAPVDSAKAMSSDFSEKWAYWDHDIPELFRSLPEEQMLAFLDTVGVENYLLDSFPPGETPRYYVPYYNLDLYHDGLYIKLDREAYGRLFFRRPEELQVFVYHAMKAAPEPLEFTISPRLQQQWQEGRVLEKLQDIPWVQVREEERRLLLVEALPSFSEFRQFLDEWQEITAAPFILSKLETIEELCRHYRLESEAYIRWDWRHAENLNPDFCYDYEATMQRIVNLMRPREFLAPLIDSLMQELDADPERTDFEVIESREKIEQLLKTEDSWLNHALFTGEKEQVVAALTRRFSLPEVEIMELLDKMGE